MQIIFGENGGEKRKEIGSWVIRGVLCLVLQDSIKHCMSTSEESNQE
jgi:hypothetical protein